MTKRQLGFSLILLGLVIAVALMLIDLLGAGQFRGIGPVQRLGLVGAGLIVAVGLSLLPLGDRPA
ncbi:MAG: hypothetical protein ACE5E7_03175 [Anaerolineae bacterium]